ncbi:MAG: diacylglycerol/polyprenol kinase family protein [Ignavibacteriales bacterium]
MTQIDKGTIQYRDELVRKTIHLFSLSIPIVYYYVTRQAAIAVLLPLTLFSLVLDLGRYFNPRLGKVFYLIFGFMLRDHEMDSKKKNLNGATYVLISALICVLLLPKVFFLTAFSVLILSDSSAALIGRKFGKHKFLSKSLEGTMAFFVSACLVVTFSPKVTGSIQEYLIGYFAVAVGAIAENVSYGWADDNMTIPLSIGFTMWLLYYIFLPGLNPILPNAPL